MSDHHQLLSTRQAAQVLGVSVRTIQLWVEQGLLHAWKTPGGHRRIDQQSLLQLLQQKQREMPLLNLVALSSEPSFATQVKLHVSQWQLPVEVSSSQNGVQALLLAGKTKADLMLVHQLPDDMNAQLLIGELQQQNCQFILCSDPQQAQQYQVPYLTYPFEPRFLKPLLQQTLLQRVRQKID
ncbi:helix-turn-helix domain-containing protein [Rheinheimera sp.]|uniref:MerR family transcriptional regulator n=1 Tax=Rheinheimera sp. TaxID=1869214 RepID=UPI00307D0542